MAKLKAPLLSLGASGAIGRSLVYFPWKGLDCVREYVVPANPDTTAQGIQRGYLKAAVNAVHDAQARPDNPLDEADMSAYALFASLQATPMTWFNKIIEMWLEVKKAEKVPVIYSDGNITDKDRTALDLFIKLNEETGSQLADGKFYFGTSKSALINAVTALITGGDKAVLEDEDLSAFLTVGKKYFVQFRPDATDPCVGANSGIYYFVAA
jgi:hypothetical protein